MKAAPAEIEIPAGAGGRRWRRALLAVTAFVPVAFLLILHLPPLWQIAGEAGLAQWDPAKYGVSGLRLAGALATADLPLFVRELNALSVWPPFFPLLEAPFFLAFGKEVTVAARLVLGLWALTLLLLPWALAPLAERRSPAPGWLAAAALAAASLGGTFAVLPMLEVPGLLLQVLALGFTLRALRGEPGAWRAAYLSCTLLFFCKYNYGLLFIVPLLIFRARLGVARWKDFAKAAVKLWRSGRWRSAWLLGAVAAILALGLVRLTGGFEFTASGREVSVRSIGNPALALLWLALLAILVSSPRRRAVFARLTAIDAEHQGLLRYLAAPILLWMLLPPHLRDFLDFVENRSSQLPFFSAESLFFYPRVFLHELSPGPLWGGAMLLLALVGLSRLGGSTGYSFLALWMAATALAAFLHPYKQDRFLFPAALALIVLAAAMANRALESVPRLRAIPWVAGLLALAAAAIFGLREEEIRHGVELRSVPAAAGAAIDAVTEAASGEPVLLLGASNMASPWLIEWRAWQSSGSWEAPRLPLWPRDLVRGADGPALASRLTRFPSRILLLEPLAENPARAVYDAENAWLAPVLEQLADEALFAAEPLRELPAAGYRLHSWRRR